MSIAHGIVAVSTLVVPSEPGAKVFGCAGQLWLRFRVSGCEGNATWRSGSKPRRGVSGALPLSEGPPKWHQKLKPPLQPRQAKELPSAPTLSPHSVSRGPDTPEG